MLHNELLVKHPELSQERATQIANWVLTPVFEDWHPADLNIAIWKMERLLESAVPLFTLLDDETKIDLSPTGELADIIKQVAELASKELLAAPAAWDEPNTEEIGHWLQEVWSCLSGIDQLWLAEEMKQCNEEGELVHKKPIRLNRLRDCCDVVTQLMLPATEGVSGMQREFGLLQEMCADLSLSKSGLVQKVSCP
jgi:hypothetical protein